MVISATHQSLGNVSLDQGSSVSYGNAARSNAGSRGASARLRGLAKQLLPPIVLTMIRSIRGNPNERREDRCQWRQVTAGPLQGYWLELDEEAAVWTGRMDRGEFEIPTATVLESVIKPGWTCFDIGAHVGYHSLLMAKLVGPTGSVHAFEPLPLNVDRIQKHVTRNAQDNVIRLHAVAISDREGTGTMRGTDRLATSSGGYLDSARPVASTRNITGFRSLPVQLQTLDHMVSQKQVPAPQLIKLDVEGAEVAALRGAMDILRKYKPFLIVEFHNPANAVEGMQLLHQAGYQTNLIESCMETCSITAHQQESAVRQ